MAPAKICQLVAVASLLQSFAMQWTIRSDDSLPTGRADLFDAEEELERTVGLWQGRRGLRYPVDTARTQSWGLCVQTEWQNQDKIYTLFLLLLLYFYLLCVLVCRNCLLPKMFLALLSLLVLLSLPCLPCHVFFIWHWIPEDAEFTAFLFDGSHSCLFIHLLDRDTKQK